MTKRVQLAGGGFDVESNLVGLERELRVDLDNDSLRLHDAVKVGGFEILNRDANNTLYQAKSPELDGFSFGAQEKGIVTRVGPALYRVRRIEVNEENMAITNPRGTAGNFYLTVAPTITSDHEATGLWTFTQPIAADGGVVGNVVGNLTGNVTGDVVGDLVGDTHGTHYGSLDTTGGDIVMEDDQLPENAVHQLLINRGVPYGAIMMWSGLVAEVPESWALCDGDNGTPDLRNRFIVGAGDDYAPLEAGGNETHTHSGTSATSGSHAHPLAIDGHELTLNEIPEHNHACGVVNGNPSFFNHGSITAVPDTANHPVERSSSGAGVEGLTTTVGSGDEHTHTGATTDSGAHSHDITLAEASNLPPYLALCFIMKIAVD